MFGDCHAIIGVLIGKCVLEWAGNSHMQLHFGTLPIPFLRSTGIALTYKDMYLILCALMANFPDIDTIIIRLLRLEHFNHHRTWSHSFLGSLFFVPLLALLVKLVLGHTVGTLHALLIAFLCFYSHLLTDWITSYGIGLFWTPGETSTEFYSLGVITIFDAVTLVIWYSCFIMSWYGILSPTRLLMLFSVALTAWLSYKRVLLFVALKYSYTLSKAPIKNAWFQPSSFNPMLYGFFQQSEDQGGIKLRADIRPYRIEPENIKKFAWNHAYSLKSLVGSELGFTRVAPREALIASATHGSVYRKWMFKQTIWSLGIVTMHFFWFIFAVINY